MPRRGADLFTEVVQRDLAGPGPHGAVRGAFRGRGQRRVDGRDGRVQPRSRRDHHRPLSRPGGAGVGAPLPHGSARLRPPDGAWTATLLRAPERRTWRTAWRTQDL